MTSRNDMMTAKRSGQLDSALGGHSTPETSQAQRSLDCPSIDEVLSRLAVPQSSLPARTATVDVDDQKHMFHSLQAFMKNAQPEDLEVDSSVDQSDIETTTRLDVDAIVHLKPALDRLWACQSEYLAQSVEILANGSRDPKWRTAYGRCGVLDFFLQVLAFRRQSSVDTGVLLHALRLVGNSCADTDENREVVVNANYTAAVIQHIRMLDLLPVVVTVVYNTCVDYVPAQSQAAGNQLPYILMKLVHDGAFEDNDGLLGMAYELIETTAEQEEALKQSPDGTLLLLMELATSKDTSFSQYSPLVKCLATYLENQRFQDICISNRIMERALSILERSCLFKDSLSTTEDVKTLIQLQLKLNQALSEVSASPLFLDHYPLDSPLSRTLMSWLEAGDDQLQVCACVMLGNLARSDEMCERMVQELNIHTLLISILNNDTRAAVLHSILGFLKNLAIASANRLPLGDAGVIPAISRLWAFETVPQVQFAAISITRQVIISSMENISRLLDSPSGSDSSRETYLAMLLSPFEKTDSTPIKIEIGRIVASICRTLAPKSREGDNTTKDLLDRLFSLHENVARPVGAMITQTQWPVVRSEGWFAFALMASSTAGCRTVSNCLEDSDVLSILEQSLSMDARTNEEDRLKASKDRDNIIVFVQELMKNESGTLTETTRSRLEDLMRNDVSQHLKNTRISEA